MEAVSHGPSPWVARNMDLIARGSLVLDVACGSGRHALFLAEQGCRVHALDRDEAKIEQLRATALRRTLDVEARSLDLEAPALDLGRELYDVVLGILYLQRSIFPSLIRAIVPGGLLLYETFTIFQAERGRPTNPDYLLQPGELRALVAPLIPVRKREGEFEGRMVSSIVARKPGS